MTAPVVKPAKKAPVRRTRKPKAVTPPHITDALTLLGRGDGGCEAYRALTLHIRAELLREGHDVRVGPS